MCTVFLGLCEVEGELFNITAAAFGDTSWTSEWIHSQANHRLACLPFSPPVVASGNQRYNASDQCESPKAKRNTEEPYRANSLTSDQAGDRRPGVGDGV